MGTQPSRPPRLAFGPFEYDELSGTLIKHGIRVRLQGKPLQILLLLVSQPGQVISRDDLKYALWQGRTFVDFEQGLNSAVNKLRQTLGDSAEQPRYVETLPGRGYRFIAPLRTVVTQAVLEMPAAALLRIKPKFARQTARWRIVASCLALAALVVSGYWLIQPLGHPIETPQTMRFAVLPPSGFALEGAASRQSFALSPDGNRLAFTAMDSSGAFSVFLRNLSSIQPQLLADSEGAHTVFWSPDSQSLYFTAKGKLWRTNLQDGARVLISESPSFLFSGAWLDSGRMLVDSFTASYLVSPSGGPLQRLKGTYWWPQRLPGGKHALYVRREIKPATIERAYFGSAI